MTYPQWAQEKALLPHCGDRFTQTPRWGWIESIGYYNPLASPKVVQIDHARLDYWKSVGAKMSERVEKTL